MTTACANPLHLQLGLPLVSNLPPLLLLKHAAIILLSLPLGPARFIATCDSVDTTRTLAPASAAAHVPRHSNGPIALPPRAPTQHASAASAPWTSASDSIVTMPTPLPPQPGPLDALWDQIASAAWVANTLIPLGFTAAGLALAYWGIRRQLRHDEHLRRADRQQTAAGILGQRIRETTTALNKPAADAWWTCHYWPDGRALNKDAGEALLSLPGNTMSGLKQAIQTLETAWQACYHSAIRIQPSPDQAIHGHDMHEVLRPLQEALDTYAMALLMWDGQGLAPEMELTDDAAPPLTDRDLYQYYFQAYLDQRARIHLIKPSGQPAFP